ncbi:MAG TPA: methylamine utilization protein, partial [Phenylobacterium sp.]|nr:methylamine utilization protein [Phenylobacterium sp.]
GRPVADAVVTVYPAAAYDKSRIRFAWPYRVSQRSMTFDPFVLVVPMGADVQFPNQDTVRHHVYSFSPAKTFELKLYGQDQTRKVTFDKAGVVAVGCNIHDNMSAYIRVVDTPFAAKTVGGAAAVRDLPAGPATVTVWRPFLKAPDNEITQRVVIPASGALRLAMTADLRPSRLRRGAY